MTDRENYYRASTSGRKKNSYLTEGKLPTVIAQDLALESTPNTL